MPEPIVTPAEAIEVPSSVSGDNIAVETPSPEPKIEPPVPTPNAEGEPAVVPPAEEPKVELFELPDGRKVDATTLSREWKENFMPDYTQKSQELAKIKPEALLATPPTSKSKDPNWQPQSLSEIIDVAKEEMKQDLQRDEQKRADDRKAIEDAVTGQLNEIKTADPTLNENALFLHANKYGFRDLKQAHQNMKDMSKLAKDVQKNTADNIAKRNDPVSIVPGATGQRPDPSMFSSAVEYMRSLNN